ncbi:clostripain-related cysteine peptidase [Paenibacillus amylolyticus]|uniref:clostripain-related cysteine peptidase n=1 Tax=Paenibacillus amylolyticus TaxID=1451 RepID=UPI003F7FCD59
MKRTIRLLVFILLVSFLPISELKASDRQADYTFLIYMIGSDMESDFHMASDDLKEMMSVGSSSNVNVVVQTGGARSWDHSSIESGLNQRWRVEKGSLALLDNAGSQNMDTSDSLTDFIRWGTREYPARKHVLMFWGHGLGPIDGYGGDEHYGNKKMSLTELQKGIGHAYNETGIKFELIGFDNCKMASVEVAYALRDYGKYLLASVDYTNQNGWDYTKMLKAVQDKSGISTLKLGRIIAQGYLEQSKVNGEEEDLQQSIIQLDQMEEVMKAIESFSKRLLKPQAMTKGMNQLRKARDQAEDYADEADLVDLADLFTLIGKRMKAETEADRVKKAIQKAVVYNMKSPEHPKGKGMSVYFPSRDVHRFTEKASKYRKLEFSSSYKAFITEYSTLLSRRPQNTPNKE